jgi:hypothetical protein
MSGTDDKSNFGRDSDREIEIRRAARRRRAIERLGCENPTCVFCGENDPLVLELHNL